MMYIKIFSYKYSLDFFLYIFYLLYYKYSFYRKKCIHLMNNLYILHLFFDILFYDLRNELMDNLYKLFFKFDLLKDIDFDTKFYLIDKDYIHLNLVINNEKFYIFHFALNIHILYHIFYIQIDFEIKLIRNNQ
jgi:hypothetical protein